MKCYLKKKKNYRIIKYGGRWIYKGKKTCKKWLFYMADGPPFKNIRRGNIKHVEGPLPYGQSGRTSLWNREREEYL